MRGSSADALATLVEELAARADEGEPGRIADDLFAVAGLLRQSPTLRRVATDVSVAAKAKSDVLRGLVQDQIDPASMDLLDKAVGLRWSATRDLADALDHLAVIAVVKDAERAGHADAVEDELFEFSRVVEENSELRDALSDRTRSLDDKRQLVRTLLEGKAGPPTIRLVEQALTGTFRTVTLALEAFRKIAAEHRNRLVAVVRVADDLDDSEVQRLESALSDQYGRPVHVNVRRDPHVIGGVKVEIGDDVIDGTVATRLDEARRRLAG
jgi:F-type H+-transporting ATPase subunit delta